MFLFKDKAIWFLADHDNFKFKIYLLNKYNIAVKIFT